MTKLSKQKRSRKSKLDSVKSKKSSKLSRKSSKKKSRRSKKSSKKSRITKKSSKKSRRSKKSSKKSRRKSKRSSRKSKKTEAKTSELNCGIEKSECEKPKYKRAEIDKLAEKCGVDYTKYKNKKSLCEAIFKKFKEQKTAPVETESETETETENCSDDLKKKSIAELKSMLDNIGFEKNKPTKKSDMIDYICSEKKNGSCDIENEKYCEGDLVCDASNPNGICISKELADSRKLNELVYNGKRIIGSKVAINKLQKFLDKKGPSVEEPNVEEPSVEEPSVETTDESESESETETEDYDSCYNDLKNKSINELKSMLDDIGFEKNKPTKKPDMVGYLCSEKVNGSCDIENEKYCGEGLVCDSSNPKGICISDELAKNRKLDEFTYNGNKIIGSKNVIKNLQSTLSKPKTQPSKPEEVVEEPQEDLPTFDEVTEDIKKNVEGDVITKKPKKKEGTKIITELDDIDEILEKIQENNEDINISGVQREILKCLGLMAN